MDDRIGQQWGNYRLLHLLGQGSFAKVYLGQHVRLPSEQAALKIFSMHLLREDVQKFHFEAETIVSLVHPHIVRVLNFGLNEGIPFLAMDYALKGSLRQQHQRDQQVDLATVVSYVQQVADGLQYAHDRKIIHRDIKPDNMLIGSRGELVLSDFGIATIAHGTRLQNAQGAIGTILYMAPEQIREHPHQASDQYALAITIYEWLAGKLPFTGTSTEVAVKHIAIPPPPLSNLVPNLPPDVERVISTALAKNPTARFENVQAFARAFTDASGMNKASTKLQLMQAPPPLRTLPASEPVAMSFSKQASSSPSDASIPVTVSSKDGWVAQKETARLSAIPSVVATPVHATDAHIQSKNETKQRQVSRRAVLAALVTLGIVASGVLIREAVVENEAHSSQPLSAPTAKPRPPIGTLLTMYHGHTDGVRSVAWSPDAKRIASASQDKTVQVWDSSTGTRAFTYTGHSDWVRSVAWSPDGKWIVSSGHDNTAQVWNATTGATITTYRRHTDHVHSIAWSPNGRRIASGSDDKTVQVWDAATGVPLFTYPGHTDAVESVAWSPNGERIASASDDKTVQVWDAATGAPLFTYPGHTDWVLSVAWSPDGTRIASTGRDQTVQVWDAATGATILTNKQHIYWTEAVSWSLDGKSIVSASDDKTVQIWNTSANTLATSTYIKHNDAEMYTVRWSPAGNYIASAGLDKTVEVWSAY